MDVEEEEGHYRVTLSVPGFSQDQLAISLEDKVLQIQGSLTGESESDEDGVGRKFHLRERHMNRFSRALRLPAGIEADQMGAQCDDGILTLTIPKPAAGRPQRIGDCRRLTTLSGTYNRQFTGLGSTWAHGWSEAEDSRRAPLPGASRPGQPRPYLGSGCGRE